MSDPRHRLAQIMKERVPIDIGTTSLTGFRSASLPASNASVIAHPIFETLPLSAEELMYTGSDLQRVGFVWPQNPSRSEMFTDSYGVRWLETDGNMAPYEHPLEHVEWGNLNNHLRPKLPQFIQFPDVNCATPTILDPPCYGLLDTCFILRGSWQFMVDLTDNYRVANALLDWALETVTEAYLTALDALPEDPDIIVYGDDFGFESGMYLSDLDFRTFIFPRLQTFFARIRKRTGALICFHSCGAISSIVNDITELGVDLLNLDFYAKNVLLQQIRQTIPSDMILHAPVNIAALGQAVQSGNRVSLALLASDLAAATPCIAGPVDNISTPEEAVDAMRGVEFVRALNNDDLHQIRNLGPVKSIIQKATDAAKKLQVPILSGREIPFGELLISDHTELLTRAKPSSRATLN